MCSRLLALLFLLACLHAGRAEWRNGGHVKYQFTHSHQRGDDLNALFGKDRTKDHSVDLRIKLGRRSGPWDGEIHYELLGAAGDALETRHSLAANGLLAFGSASGLPNDGRRLFKLTDEITEGGRLAAVHRLDRLSLGYSRQRWVVRFGRQAISWGNGLVFQTLDFVNPFSPIAIDKEFKTGNDMLYSQWLVGNSGDLQSIVVPRRDPKTNRIRSDQSSYAAKLHSRLLDFEVDVLVARHFDENLFGVGLVRSLGGSVWRFDVGYTDMDDGHSAVSFVTNLDYSWILGGKNWHGYLEYFRSGVGEADGENYATPDRALVVRIERGELFTLGRDIAGLGLQVELTPLLNLFNNLIWNLNDRSLFYQLRSVYDWKQNVQIMAGLNFPSGDRGTEYGGIPVPALDAFAAPARLAYLRMAYFF